MEQLGSEKMRIRTRVYGMAEIEERQCLRFADGLYGFEQYQQWALLDSHRPPFLWLQSLQEARIAFVLINPYLFRPDYVLDIPDEHYQRINLPGFDDMLVFAIVTIPDSDAEEITANLQGPLIINRSERIGIQSISQNPEWHTRHRIVQPHKANAHTDAAR